MHKEVLRLSILSSLLVLASAANAQEAFSLEQTYEIQASLSNGNTPLWLNANKYGLSSLHDSYGYGRAAIRAIGESGKFLWETGADVVIPVGMKSRGFEDCYTTHFILQQLYAEIQYKHCVLSFGAKQREMELKDNELSSGSQTFGINARPIPQVRLDMDDFWTVPGLKGWIGVKAQLAYGLMTDGTWEESFAKGTKCVYNRRTRYHEKSGFLHIGKEGRPFSVTAGLEMASQFGGDVYNWTGTDETQNDPHKKIHLDSNLRSYVNAFFGIGGGDVGEKQFKNAEGNMLGSWIIRADWKRPNYSVGFYIDHYFEDHSSMFFLDYDGYGTGSEWDKAKNFSMFVYNPQDALVGMDLKLENCRYVDKLLVEFLNTRYQSGPIYHDHNPNSPDHISGIDKYYNHSSLPGWQHWGQVMGNPLYLSPLYNKDGYIGTHCNRFLAWHFGASGFLLPQLRYRALLSWQRGWGTYDMPYIHPAESISYLVEAAYDFERPEIPLSLHLSYGADYGKLRGDNQGLQFTLQYHIR